MNEIIIVNVELILNVLSVFYSNNKLYLSIYYFCGKVF